MHNTEITSFKLNEEKDFDKKKYKNHHRGRKLSLMEQIQIMLKYKEVYTNLNSINIPTKPFEVCAGIKKYECARMNILEHDDNPKDGFRLFCISDKIMKL